MSMSHEPLLVQMKQERTVGLSLVSLSQPPRSQLFHDSFLQGETYLRHRILLPEPRPFSYSGRVLYPCELTSPDFRQDQRLIPSDAVWGCSKNPWRIIQSIRLKAEKFLMRRRATMANVTGPKPGVGVTVLQNSC
jgi:hypothetical protein